MKRYEKKDLGDRQKIRCSKCSNITNKNTAVSDGWVIKGIESFCPGCPVE